MPRFRSTGVLVAMPATPGDGESLRFRHVIVRGTYDASRQVLIDNRLHQERAGYHVITPLRLEGSEMHVLVNRGWIPAPRLRSELPSVPTAIGEVEVSGVTRSFETRTFELQETAPQGSVWQHVREADYRQRSGLDALPVVLLQIGADKDGLIRDWGSADNPAIKHHGYMAMWLVFALMAVAYGLFAWRKK